LSDRGVWVQKFRVPIGFAVAGLYLFFARPQATALLVGGLIALVGVLIRAWAAGHIVKNDRLATTGPYAHTRNPLYFGSFLIACGFALIASRWLLIAVAVFWVLVYAPTIRREREHVSALYPKAYADWARHVPEFVPRPLPWREGNLGEASRFDFGLYLRHREWQAGLVYVVAMAWLYFRMRRGF
jgi:protein-S-isoprenylcysteine O-methyltransferase Ste14